MIAVELDLNFEEIILGTIAGGDTIFVALKEHVKHNEFQAQLDFLIPKIE